MPDRAVQRDVGRRARHILETKEAEFDPSRFVDHYEEAVVEMLKHKQAGIPARGEHPSAPPPNVINLMDALKRSIAGEKVAPSFDAAPKKTRCKRIAGQREMLLPLPGNKTKEPVAAKSVTKSSTRQKKAG